MMDEAIIVDIDGTIALMMGKRSPYDSALAMDDEPNKPIIHLMKILASYHQCKILLMSGRENLNLTDDDRTIHDDTYSLTMKWLKTYCFDEDQNFDWELIMRERDDKRKDSYVKYDMYKEHVEGKYEILYVLDDRNQVVDMWRNALNLTCLQVADGNF
jgi:hypothetical protein